MIDKPMTENQWEVLEGLWNMPHFGVAPMDFGGSNGSHHSNTATALCKKANPLVERRKRGVDWGEKSRWRERGSYVYRLTPLGVSIVEEKHPKWAARRKPDAVQPEIMQ